MKSASTRWLWLSPLICSIAIAALGSGLANDANGRNGLIAMGAGLAIVLAAVYATLGSMLRKLVTAPPSERLQLALRAGVTRFLIAIALSAAVAWRTGLPPAPLLISVAVGYFVIVQSETVILVRWMASLEK